MADYVDDYRADGFAVLPGVFGSADVAALSAEFDRLKAAARRYHGTFRHGNVLYLFADDPALGRVLRFLQWPSYVNAVLASYRVDARLYEIVAPLLGRDLKQIINQCVWKPPGSIHTGYAYHQDARFRRPARAFRNLATSYVQTAIAVDPHEPENGGLRMGRGSHRHGILKLGTDSILSAECDDEALRRAGLDPVNATDIHLAPGDVVMWGAYTVHGSPCTRATIDRRVYLNGFIAASECDRGEWAFRDGQPCPLGEPRLIAYEDLYTRPEPHYVEGPPFPYRGD